MRARSARTRIIVMVEVPARTKAIKPVARIVGVLRPPAQARIRATDLALANRTTMERARNVVTQGLSARTRIIAMVVGHAQTMATRPVGPFVEMGRRLVLAKTNAMTLGLVRPIIMARARFVEHLLASVTKPNTVMVLVHALETVSYRPRLCVGRMLANVMFPNTVLAHQHLALQMAMRRMERRVRTTMFVPR